MSSSDLLKSVDFINYSENKSLSSLQCERRSAGSYSIQQRVNKRSMMFIFLLLLIKLSSHCCVIEWTDSKLEMATETDISDFDGKFTVNWAQLVKHPHLCYEHNGCRQP